MCNIFLIASWWITIGFLQIYFYPALSPLQPAKFSPPMQTCCFFSPLAYTVMGPYHEFIQQCLLLATCFFLPTISWLSSVISNLLCSSNSQLINLLCSTNSQLICLCHWQPALLFQQSADYPTLFYQQSSDFPLSLATYFIRPTESWFSSVIS